MENDKVGFIDEFGDKSIEYHKSGVTTYFIVSAIIVNRESIQNISNSFRQIAAKYTQAPEIKSSSKTFQNLDKRISFLTEISKLDFNVYSIIVDKRKIFEDSGLQFKNSFFKYVNSLLDIELYRFFPYLELVADEHGSEKFIEGFIEYVKKNHNQLDLYRKPTFRFGNSKNEPLIQLADFISGTLARCYDPEKRISNPNLILDILSKNILYLREWPETPLNIYKSAYDGAESFNQNIANFTLNLARKFISENEHKTDFETSCQLICLHYLIFRFRNDPFAYVYADEILERINKKGVFLQKRVFSKDVISRLRDCGILVVSSQSGYKIPCSEADLIRFFNNYSSKIIPMLKTLEKSNVLIKTATDGHLNMFNIKEFKLASELVEVLKKSQS